MVSEALRSLFMDSENYDFKKPCVIFGFLKIGLFNRKRLIFLISSLNMQNTLISIVPNPGLPSPDKALYRFSLPSPVFLAGRSDASTTVSKIYDR